MAASNERGEVDNKIRKYRKKLRQIENLECMQRDLTGEEQEKVSRKSVLRAELRCLLAEYALNDTNLSGLSTDSYKTAHGADVFIKEEVEDQCNELEYSGQGGDSLGEVTFEQSVENVEPNAQEQIAEQAVTSTAHGLGEPLEQLSTDVLQSPLQSVKPSKQENRPTEEEEVPAKRKKTSDSKTKKRTETEAEKQANEKRRLWRNRVFGKTYLEGHNDLVSCVVTDGSIAVSGSRDTTVKVWDLESSTELKSFGGHTETVTCCLLLSLQESQRIGIELGIEAGDQIVLSGSMDCSVRLWSIKSGKLLKSIYTYNPVTCMDYKEDLGLILTGSGGGKVDMWRPQSGDNVQTVLAHEEAVTDLKALDCYVYAACTNGLIKVFEMRGETLHPVFESENVRSSISGNELPWRRICCLAPHNQIIYYGDDGVNIKVMHWRKGVVSKLKNHSCEFGATDALTIHNDVLVSSGLDIDTGTGYLNFYSVLDNKYLASLVDDEVPRILCIACCTKESRAGLRILTGGNDLILWQEMEANAAEEESECLQTVYVPCYDQSAVDSDISETETDLSDNEQNAFQSNQNKTHATDDSSSKAGWSSWCSVV